MKFPSPSVLVPAVLLTSAVALGAALPLARTVEPAAPATTAVQPLVHCQVPCGVYGDQMRIDMLMEDAATIEKGMKALAEMEGEEAPSRNQMVRWILTKDEHAQKIQDQVAAYWLTQRIQKPAADAGEAGRAKYLQQLELMHDLTVAAMKCKQTIDPAHVETLRAKALAFSATYFSEDDLKHIREHHAAEKHR